MKRMKKFAAGLLAVVLCLALSVSAFASSGFNAGIDVTREGDEIAVVVQDSTVLHDKKPTLTIPADASFEQAKVLFEGTAVTVAYADGQVSFKVSKGGTYRIVKGLTGTLAEAPTCTAEGTIAYQYDGETYVEAVAKLAHDFTDITKETCANCSEPNPNYEEPYEPPYIPPHIPPYVPPVVTPDPEPAPAPDPVEPESPTVDTDAPVVDTTVTENEDGSTTKTEILENGAVVETTTNTDGSKTETATQTETAKTEEGIKTTTTSNTIVTDAEGIVSTETKVEEKVETADGTTIATTTTTTETAEKTETVEVKEVTAVTEDGTVETVTTSTTTVETADGTTATATTDETGKTEVEVVLSDAAVEAAAESGEAVALPIPAVTADTEAATAPVVTVTTNTQEATKVEIPVEDVAAGIVAVLVHEDGSETVIKDSVVTENGVVANLPDGATVKVVDNSKNFDDVKESSWHSDAVDFVSSRELFNGVNDTSFNPDGNMTRGMLLTVLARLDGQDTTPEEDQHWQDPGVEWAVNMGLSDGSNPNDNITREQIAVLLWRYAGSPTPEGDLSDFVDGEDANGWAVEALKWAVESGVMNGKGNQKLDPKGFADRAQVAQFLKNFIENVK